MKHHQTTAFKMEYTFNTTKDRVFAAFSNAAALNEWWGPVEMHNTVISLDFRPGGIFHFKMEKGEVVNYGRFLFRNIIPNELLEFTNAFADENARVIKAPFDIDLPLEILYNIRFSEHDGKTTIAMTGTPVDANEAETTGFNAINDGMRQGFTATYDKLTDHLNKHTSK